MYDRTRAYITGASGALIKTVDRGLTWVGKYSERESANTVEDLFTLALSKRDELVFAGENKYCRRVNDQADFASSMFWYDKLGRLAVSQNTRQFNKTTEAYSYTLFDPLGRITEVGEKATDSMINTTLIGLKIDESKFSDWLTFGDSSTRTEVTQTFYDAQFSGISYLEINQLNMVKRVASVTYEDVYDGEDDSYQSATHYSYDVHGNVDHMVQEVPALAAVDNQYKHIYYDYDLVSGKVNQVDYNPGFRDEYHHRYVYDADNRLIEVQTSHDAITWDVDGSYEYYLHGPLARTEIGDLKVQGLDYVYTIQGWIKGVNSNTMDETRDPGKDGVAAGINEAVGRDAFGYTLGYFEGDYAAIASFSTTDNFEAAVGGSDLIDNRYDLWNGNISHMVTCLPEAADYNTSKIITPEAFGNAYKYDQLNRIISSRTYINLDYGANEWDYAAATPDNFATDYTYDAMGNILTQKRNGHSSVNLALDDLTYKYNTNADGLISNRLYSVDDAVSAGNYADDIDEQDYGKFDNDPGDVNVRNNYGYDELGNLVRDSSEEIGAIEWTVYGKIKSVTRSGGSKANLEFGYDASGNRLWKKVTENAGAGDVKTYYYLRDAQGNEMSRYVHYTNGLSEELFVAEEHSIYGSSRLGIDNRRDTLYKDGVFNPAWYSNNIYVRALGNKSYEMSNHLGNVLVTVTDKKVYVNAGGGAIYFEAEITSISDYYPFGSGIQARSYSSGAYRFGFNGKEKDDEIKVVDGSYDFGARAYDGRLGRWLSVDYEFSKGAAFSPYCSFLNNPILLEDPDGNWVKISIKKYYKNNEGVLKEKKWFNIFKKTVKIEKRITIGDVRFLDLNTDYWDHLFPLTTEQRTKIIENYKSELIAAYGGESFKEVGEPEIETFLSFEGEMKFVNDLSELKGGEELLVVGSILQKGHDARAIDQGKSLVGIGASEALMQGTKDDDGNCFAHEFTHQRTRDFKEYLFQAFVNLFKKYPSEGGYFDHAQEGIFELSQDPKANYKNADSIKKGSDGIKTGRTERKLYEYGYDNLYK